tara:strand:- start:208 stop:729 length:522 start_codon:yes stop_codon:yes gene_type:complete
MNYSYFPKDENIPESIKTVVNIFKNHEKEIDSSSNDSTNEKRLSSDEVLKILEADFLKEGYLVEKSKAKNDKIRMQVDIGINDEASLFFEVDAWNEDEGIVIEVEAGRALDNHQFLKDIFEAAMMKNVKYLIIAVRECYRGRNDYRKINDWLEPFYSTERVKLDLEGLLLIGY